MTRWVSIRHTQAIFFEKSIKHNCVSTEWCYATTKTCTKQSLLLSPQVLQVCEMHLYQIAWNTASCKHRNFWWCVGVSMKLTCFYEVYFNGNISVVATFSLPACSDMSWHKTLPCTLYKSCIFAVWHMKHKPSKQIITLITQLQQHLFAKTELDVKVPQSS